MKNFQILFNSDSSLLGNYVTLLPENRSFEMDSCWHYHDSTTKSNYCQIEIDYKLNLLAKLLKELLG